VLTSELTEVEFEVNVARSSAPLVAAWVALCALACCELSSLESSPADEFSRSILISPP
jgi:hypothetical protein